MAILSMTAGSPSANSAAIQTGRPSMWTTSAQRQMSRLYLYTNLPIEKIRELIHFRSPKTAPGTESANKKLNILLDKEPRWLRPRQLSDMGRRVNELANSPTRLRLATNAAVLGNSRSTSNHSIMSLSPEDSVSPAFVEASMGLHSAVSFATSPHLKSSPDFSLEKEHEMSPTMEFAETTPHQDEEADARRFAGFLRRTTCLSTSTNQTTGSFHRVLAGYSKAFIKTAKRLVKRFTAPMTNQDSLSPSFSDDYGGIRSWIDDEDCPLSFDNGPFPIPGDYLYLDEYSKSDQCYATHEAHMNQRCLCFMNLDSCVLPWVGRTGLTAVGDRVLSVGPTQQDARATDTFGNTVLHFLAARGSIANLNHALQVDSCKTLIAAKNTAGQTFLHVLNRRILENPDYVFGLLSMLSEKDRLLIHSRDCYGRSFFHLLRDGQHSQELLNHVSGFCDPKVFAARDAFGHSPALGATLAMDPGRQHETFRSTFGTLNTPDAGIAEESRLLEHVRLAGKNPELQDAHGRNGLHCLAMATLSQAQVVNKYHKQSPPRRRITRRRKDPQIALDSCTERLNFRLGLLIDLLDAGVDPNHHDNDGNTPLMAFAAELPEDDDRNVPPMILKTLISRGASIDARNRCGETALQIAVRCGRKLAMKTLGLEGANVHVQDSAGRSLLDVVDVKMMSCWGDDYVIQYAHYEACRAWLSGVCMAVQRPTVVDEWGVPRR